ncbi:MAG TPA: hypothetical protein VG797_02335 [Phycisphaerales bacterium]|nr:hypothetical protein [Phycisphaerales bacterium]
MNAKGDMHDLFTVRGVSPVTGRTVELILYARTASEAKRQAESAGLSQVIAEARDDSGMEGPSASFSSDPAAVQHASEDDPASS